MKQIVRILVISLFTILRIGFSAHAERLVTDLNGEWLFKPITDNQQGSKYQTVTVPHTWNAEYVPGTLADYNRETMVYRRELGLSPEEGRRYFLYFEGVNSVCNVFVNFRHVTEHKGGYTAFCVEITDFLKEKGNMLELWVSNAWRPDVLPIIGDFNICGGIHRPVHVVSTDEQCISPVFYASPGVFVEQKSISPSEAFLEVRTLVDATDMSGLQVDVQITDQHGQLVAEASAPALENTVIPVRISSPSLWNGLSAPNLYDVVSILRKDGREIDRVKVTTGFRTLDSDCEKGIILNGKPYPVYGFCRHEDFAGRGSALLPQDYERDFELIRESGATALRLAHYPHAEADYDFADREGLLIWTEIPMCGPGGFQFAGYIDSEGFKENARQCLYELVYQKFNHPSICFWGLFNEILYSDGRRFVDYGDPAPFVRELNDLYKRLDPTRLTTFATCENQKHFLGCSDLVAWNKYFGWYDRDMDKAAKFFDDVHDNSAPYPVGISEYGGGASIYHHAAENSTDDVVIPAFHPEERQALCHEDNWAIFKARPWVWGTFIWNLADFHSYVRREGDSPGLNDKGLVTYDRTIRKDAYFFYKAEWTTEPMVYITSRRFTERTEPVTDVKAYSNQQSVTLYVNGTKIGVAKNDGMSRFVWKGITLQKGENEIRVESGNKKSPIVDSCIWTLK